MKSGDFEDLYDGKVKDFTVNGECSCCGECCSNLLPLTEYEIKKIHNYIAKRHIKRAVRKFPTVDISIDMKCPFRNDEKRICEIYKIRPLICKTFKCNKEVNEKDGRLLAEEPRMLVNMREEFFKEV